MSLAGPSASTASCVDTPPLSPPPTATLLGKRRPQQQTPHMTLQTCRLPAKTPLYLCAARLPTTSEDKVPALSSSEAFSARVPSTRSGVRVLEYKLVHALQLVQSAVPPDEEQILQHGCAGWRSADGDTVRLLAPGDVLQLIDDDKQAGLAQAFLTDMFARASLKQA